MYRQVVRMCQTPTRGAARAGNSSFFTHRQLQNFFCDLISPKKKHQTLPAHCYHQQDFFEKEMDVVLGRSWLFAGHANVLLPERGAVAEVTIAGESVVLVRGKGKEISAFYNVCPHRGHELVEPKTRGLLRSKAMVCPNHGWSFHSETGELVKAKNSEGVPDFCKSDFDLKRVAAKEMAGLVFVNLEADVHGSDSPSDFFGGDLESVLLEKIPGIDSPNMKQLAVSETVVNANWKILVDNFLECYHCDIAHKAFVDVVTLDDYSTSVKPHHVIFESSCRPDNKAYLFSKDEPLQRAFFCWLWPYSAIYKAPGSSNLSILEFIPLSPTTCLRRSERFSIQSASSSSDSESAYDAAQAHARVDYLNKVLLQEDIGICESVQRGVRSRAYKHGRLMVSHGDSSEKWQTELAVAYFHQLLREHTGLTD